MSSRPSIPFRAGIAGRARIQERQGPGAYAGNDEAAKTKVKNLIESIWFGYMAKKGTGIAPAWVNRE
jgi:hypothetical protein